MGGSCGTGGWVVEVVVVELVVTTEVGVFRVKDPPVDSVSEMPAFNPQLLRTTAASKRSEVLNLAHMLVLSDNFNKTPQG